MVFKNYYKVLGIKDFSTGEEIKRAYRALAFRYHPDHNIGGASGADRFREIKEAYETLKDPLKRKHFDASLRALNFNPPSYAFCTYYTPTATEAPLDEVPAKMNTGRNSVAAGWVKLLILIVITAGLMFAVLSPPAWLSNIFGNK